MSKDIHDFEYTVGFNVVKSIHTDFTEARRIGDQLADKHERDVVFKAYNQQLHRWETLGTFLGNKRYVSVLSGECTISEDYTRLIRKEASNE